MKITEARLKEIIKEELEENALLAAAIEKLAGRIEELDVSIDYLAASITGEDPFVLGYGQGALGRLARPSKHTKQSSAEELREALAKSGIILTEEQIEEGWKERVAAAVIGGMLAVGGGALQHKVDAHQQQLKDQITANVDAAAEYKASDMGIIRSLQKQLDNTAAYLWTWSPDPQDVTMLPLSDSGAGVLPPEFSVMKQVVDDYASGAGPAYNADDVIAPSGDPEQNRLNFEEEFSEKEFESWGGSRGIQGTVYPAFGDIDENYAMPSSTKSKSQLYVELWNQYVQQPLERVENR